MDQLKTFAVPLVALVLLLVWYFVLRPMLAAPELLEAAPGGDPPVDGRSAPASTE